MKKISLLFLAVLFITVQGCKKDDSNEPDDKVGGGNGNPVEEIKREQKTVGFYFSGNWCGPCGRYGKPMLKNMTAKYPDNFLVISSQLNGSGPDPMNCPAANELAGIFRANSVPSLFTGGGAGLISKVGGSAGMEAGADNNIAAVLGREAIANSKVTATANGTELTVATKTKFFVEQAEQYRIAVYVLEDGLAFPQYSSATGKWDYDHIHYNIIRSALTEVAGDNLIKGATANQEVEMSFTGTLESKWKTDKLKVTVVLWRVNADGKITIVNGTTAKVTQ